MGRSLFAAKTRIYKAAVYLYRPLHSQHYVQQRNFCRGAGQGITTAHTAVGINNPGLGKQAQDL
jgi:hypothetical protein